MVNLATNINEVGIINNSLQNALDTYFKELELQSKNTANNYRNWFEDFFKFVYDKEMKFVTWEDISNQEYINVNTIKKYRIYLTDKKKNSNTTINMKISALKSLFQELNNIQFVPLNMNAFNVKRLKESKSNTYGTLTDEEIKNLFNYCKDKENYGYLKYLLFKTLYVTAYRFEAVRTLKVKDIKQKIDKDTGLNVWTISTIDKGNKSLIKAISDDFYNELSALLEGKKKNDYIFTIDGAINPISDETIRQCFDRYCKHYGVDKKGRNIVLHSIKHSSATKGYELSNHDLKRTQHQANHAKVSTTLDSYVNNDIPLTQHISYIIDQDIDKTQLDNLSQEQLLDIIKSSNDSIFLELVRQAKVKGFV